MKVVRLLAPLFALAVAACGDGSIKSPDFESVTTLNSIEILPAQEGQPSTLPAGTTLSYTAQAYYTVTLPPGSKDEEGNPISTESRTENITDRATWTSNNLNVATVEAGVVTGKSASATPVTITASFEGRTDTVTVTVTPAELRRVDYIKPVGPARDADDTYQFLAGNDVSFEMYGSFSGETTPRRLDPGLFTINWSSSDPAVASNADVTDNTFTANSVGTAVISGEVQGIDAVPNSASATMNVIAASEACEREFRAPTAVVSTARSPLCLGCGVTDPENVIDGDLNTEAAMSIPLGLLASANVSLTVSDPTSSLPLGKPVGFVISRSAQVLSAELLSTVRITTVQCDDGGINCTDVQTFRGDGNVLRLSLLGLLGNVPQYRLTSDQPITEPANGLRLTFNGGLVGLLARLNVQTACASAVLP